jgi:hypothetical protein
MAVNEMTDRICAGKNNERFVGFTFLGRAYPGSRKGQRTVQITPA